MGGHGRHQTRVFHKKIVAKDSGKRPQESAVARGASGGVSSIAHLGVDYRRLNREAQRCAATGGSKGELKVGNRTVCREWMHSQGAPKTRETRALEKIMGRLRHHSYCAMTLFINIAKRNGRLGH